MPQAASKWGARAILLCSWKKWAAFLSLFLSLSFLPSLPPTFLPSFLSFFSASFFFLPFPLSFYPSILPSCFLPFHPSSSLPLSFYSSFFSSSLCSLYFFSLLINIAYWLSDCTVRHAINKIYIFYCKTVGKITL